VKRYTVDFTVGAIDQLEALELYIAGQGDPDAGARYVTSIVGHCRKLDTFPLRGTPRNDLMSGLRTIAFERRVVIGYLVEGDAVWIVGISYGGRSLSEVFGHRD
jgi:plasmid stabilization system protein ParE